MSSLLFLCITGACVAMATAYGSHRTGGSFGKHTMQRFPVNFQFQQPIAQPLIYPELMQWSGFHGNMIDYGRQSHFFMPRPQMGLPVWNFESRMPAWRSGLGMSTWHQGMGMGLGGQHQHDPFCDLPLGGGQWGNWGQMPYWYYDNRGPSGVVGKTTLMRNQFRKPIVRSQKPGTLMRSVRNTFNDVIPR